MFYYVYKTTNLVNGKIYIGAKMSKSLNDGYLGSGTAFSKAIKKYGKEKFKKEILMLFDSMEEMYLNEAHIVTKEFIKRKDNYNLKPGDREVAFLEEKHHKKLSLNKVEIE